MNQELLNSLGTTLVIVVAFVFIGRPIIRRVARDMRRVQTENERMVAMVNEQKKPQWRLLTGAAREQALPNLPDDTSDAPYTYQTTGNAVFMDETLFQEHWQDLQERTNTELLESEAIDLLQLEKIYMVDFDTEVKHLQYMRRLYLAGYPNYHYIRHGSSH